MYGLDSQLPNRSDSVSNLQWFSERLPAQHTDAHIMAYEYEDLDVCTSIGTVDSAAKSFLSELDGSNLDKYNFSSDDLGESESLGVLDPAMPLLFICRGFAGLVVKKVCTLDDLSAPSFG